jgi:hypothetical protein
MEQSDYKAEGYGIEDCYPLQDDICPSCGVPYVDHKGLIPTCADLTIALQNQIAGRQEHASRPCPTHRWCEKTKRWVTGNDYCDSWEAVDSK